MNHKTHEAHDHVHAKGCGHPAIQHQDHVDYLHDGHLHHSHADHTDECTLTEDARNPAQCTPKHACGAHEGTHRHGPSCGHPAAPHGDHMDYLVDGHLHHPHDGHCDDHGKVQVMS